MKNLFLFAIVSVVLMLSSCSKVNKEEQCKKALEHFINLTISQMTDEMPEDAKNKYAKELREMKVAPLNDCVAEVKQETINCVLKAKKIDDIGNCK